MSKRRRSPADGSAKPNPFDVTDLLRDGFSIYDLVSAFGPIADIGNWSDHSSMMFIRASLAASLLLASGGMAAAIPLDGFVSFDDPYRCYTSKDFGMLLNGVIRWEELSEPTPSNDIYKGTLTSPAVPANYRKQIGKPTLAIDGDEYRATIPLRGTWQGLPLRSLVVVQWVESEGGFYLVFDATREQVLDAANNAGFKIPPSGSEYRDRDPDIGVNIGVESYDGLEALYCIDG